MSDFTKSGELQQDMVDAQGDMMRAFWKKYDVKVAPEVAKACGVSN